MSIHLRLDDFPSSISPSRVQGRVGVSVLSALMMLALWLPIGSKAQDTKPLSTVQDPRIFLLGEVHDNIHAHKKRLDFVKGLINGSSKPVIAMEQFDRNRQSTLDTALSQCQDVDCVIQVAGAPGWEWSFYRPWVQWALDQKVTLLAANLSDEDVRKVMGQGFSAVYSSEEISQLNLDHLSPVITAHQTRAIKEGHCNMLPTQAIEPMVKGQISRDVWMAKVINTTNAQLIILIAGNGHVRKDIGVFQWLTADRKQQTQVHGFSEQDDLSSASYFDELHLVASFDREDPCKAFIKKNQK
jgi:uncharacterized iron-regulated protein